MNSPPNTHMLSTCFWIVFGDKFDIAKYSRNGRNSVTNAKPRVESRKGAWPGPTGSRRFPFPAHQTGRVHLGHPAFRLVSPQHTHERSTPRSAGRRHRGLLASHCDTAGSKGPHCYAVL